MHLPPIVNKVSYYVLNHVVHNVFFFYSKKKQYLMPSTMFEVKKINGRLTLT